LYPGPCNSSAAISSTSEERLPAGRR